MGLDFRVYEIIKPAHDSELGFDYIVRSDYTWYPLIDHGTSDDGLEGLEEKYEDYIVIPSYRIASLIKSKNWESHVQNKKVNDWEATLKILDDRYPDWSPYVSTESSTDFSDTSNDYFDIIDKDGNEHKLNFRDFPETEIEYVIFEKNDFYYCRKPFTDPTINDDYVETVDGVDIHVSVVNNFHDHLGNALTVMNKIDSSVNDRCVFHTNSKETLNRLIDCMPYEPKRSSVIEKVYNKWNDNIIIQIDW